MLKKKIEEITKWNCDNAVDTIAKIYGLPIENIRMIETVTEYVDFISELSETNYVSRGQKDCTFSLLPSLVFKEKLNEAYDKDMDTMQRKIDKLTAQVSTLKEKISKAETFLKVKGLLEEFLDYLKPKSISQSLSEKKKEVEEYDKTHAKKSVKKDRGIAV